MRKGEKARRAPLKALARFGRTMLENIWRRKAFSGCLRNVNIVVARPTALRAAFRKTKAVRDTFLASGGVGNRFIRLPNWRIKFCCSSLYNAFIIPGACCCISSIFLAANSGLNSFPAGRVNLIKPSSCRAMNPCDFSPRDSFRRLTTFSETAFPPNRAEPKM